MAAPLGRWRATYTPGAWIVLAGPTCVVVMQPASGKHSALLSLLWQEVLGSASLVEVAERLAGHRIDTMPSFGAFFWTEGGMRSLVRGDVKVVDVATNTVVASGEGIQTWTEAGLDGVSQVRIDMPEIGAPEPRAGDVPLELPLVIGAVRASSVLLDGSAAAPVTSPQDQQGRFPVEDERDGQDGQGGQYEQGESGPRAHPGTEDDSEASRDAEAGSEAGFEADADPDDFADTVDQEPSSEPELDGPMTEPFPGPVATPAAGLGAAAAAGPQLAPELLEQIEYGDTELMAPVSSQDSMENGDTELMAPISTSPSSGGATSQDSMIMAVVCQYGHASPQNATVCRICGSPIVPQGPQLVPRPPLALLRASNGATEEVDRVVLVGRAPAANASTARSPRLMTVLSPSHDISRTHVEVAPEGWQVVVTDLRSTNGTTLVQPGTGARTQLPPGEPVPVPLGTVIELGDGVSVLIDFPQ